MKTIKDLFDSHVDVKVDNKLAFLIKQFLIKYSSHHAEFIGGNLIGHENLFFKTADVNYFLNVIVGIDNVNVRKDFRYIKAIVPSRKVTSDVFNLSIVYLVHRFHKASMSKGIKEEAIHNLLVLFNLRTLSALHSNSFTFLVPKGVAVAAYERLSNKYILKQKGSWQAYINYRVEQVVSKKSIHKKAIEVFKDDDALTMIADMQNRIRSFFKLYYRQMLAVKEGGTASEGEGMVVSIDGDESIAEMKNDTTDALRKVMNALVQGESYIDKKILDLVTSVYDGVDLADVVTVLKYLADRSDKKVIIRLIESTVLTVHNYLIAKGYMRNHRQNLPYLTAKSKGFISGSKISQKDMLKLRKDYYVLSKKAIDRVSKQYIVGLRNAVILYIFIFSVSN